MALPEFAEVSEHALRNASLTAAATVCVVWCVATAKRLNVWGATRDEVLRALPGDDEVAHPCVATTRAITIDSPSDAVWPWLVQMGWRRGGWYSYNAIDNDRLRSADQIMPALQELCVGDVVPEGEGVGWTVTEIERGRLVLLTTHGPMAGVDWIERRDSSWLFLIEPVDGEHSRLIERARTAVKGTPGTPLGDFASTRFFGAALAVGDFVMAHRHMKGLKRRAEHEWSQLQQARTRLSRCRWRAKQRLTTDLATPRSPPRELLASS